MTIFFLIVEKKTFLLKNMQKIVFSGLLLKKAYADIWLFELKNSNFFVLYLKSYLHLSHLVRGQAFNSKG